MNPRIVPYFASLLLASLTLAACQTPLTREGLPKNGRGSFARDENGFPMGTGWQGYLYPSGQVKRREAYVDGVLRRSIWYRPDGTIVATTDWKRGSGTGYELRDDGTILWKKEYTQGIADGQTTFYRPDGSIEKTQQFDHGQLIGPP